MIEHSPSPELRLILLPDGTLSDYVTHSSNMVLSTGMVRYPIVVLSNGVARSQTLILSTGVAHSISVVLSASLTYNLTTRRHWFSWIIWLVLRRWFSQDV
jgi:hypothetical protein